MIVDVVAWTVLCTVVSIGLGLGIGLVAAAMKVAGGQDLWFLALRMPEPYQWPTIAAMIVLGALILTAAVRVTLGDRMGDGGLEPPTSSSSALAGPGT